MIGTGRGTLALTVTLTLMAATPVAAIFLDENQNFSLTGRFYSQAAIRTRDSAPSTEPVTKSGQLVQNRNFFNPEMDAKLTSYTNWMNGGWLDWMKPDDFRFRIAAWGFYDGIYDYGSQQFNQNADILNDSFVNRQVFPGPPVANPTGGYYMRGSNIKLCNPFKAGAGCAPVTNFTDVFPNVTVDDARDVYAHQARVNELYLSYTKGPFFLRFGKQSISWGESDTIALLDQSNPFDLTLAAPGFFEDIDEARIPLYTLRTSYNLFDSWGPLSGAFIEGYMVPGPLDATTAMAPILTVSPYSPRGEDLQTQNAGVFPPSFQFVYFDHTPRSDWSSTRWGARFQTLVNRDVTMQAWVYRTYPNSPVPLKIGYQGVTPPPVRIGNRNFYIISLEHKPVMVYGLSATFFLEWLDGVMRINTQFFEHEAGFVPQTNLNICPFRNKPRTCPSGRNPIASSGFIPYQDVLRYEIGFDRFFFARFLNPSNAFTMSASVVGSYNASWTNTSSNDFRFNGIPKPSLFKRNPNGSLTPVPRGAFQDDYVNTMPVDAQGQITLFTDYLHGRVQPRVTYIQYVRGTYAVHPTLTYRWNDSLLFQLDYQLIGGAYQALGFFRDRDQVAFRATYQLN